MTKTFIVQIEDTEEHREEYLDYLIHTAIESNVNNVRVIEVHED